MSFVARPPYQYSFTQFLVHPAGFEVRSGANRMTGIIGASIGAYGVGYYSRVTSVGFDHVPARGGNFAIVVNSAINFHGYCVCPFSGFARAYTALRVYVELLRGSTDATVFQGSTPLMDAGGPLIFDFPVIDNETRTASVSLNIPTGRTCRIWADAVQSVGSAGVGMAGSNLSIRIHSVSVNPVL